jgi:L-2-hydroxyglutarate oxidase
MTDIVVVGGGIVGLAVARSLIRSNPQLLIRVLEKETSWSAQVADQGGGIIHSGVGYQPGSLKAKLARVGNERLVRFCQEHSLPHEVCGKVIVATDQDELPALNRLFERGRANGVPVRRMSPEELRQREPHVRGIAALHVPTSGIVDFVAVADKLAELVFQCGVDLRLGTRLESIERSVGEIRLGTDKGVFSTRFLINCAGLFNDRSADPEGEPSGRDNPGRGDYFQLRSDRNHLVRHLVFPVPDSRAGSGSAHLTRSVHGGVFVGPNFSSAASASMGASSEPRAHNFSEAKQILRSEDTAARSGRQARRGLIDTSSWFQLKAFTRRLQRLVPELRSEDIVPSPEGTRTQPIASERDLAEDFQFVSGRNSLHVCLASAPSATLALELGHYVAAQAMRATDFPSSVAPSEGWEESAENYCEGICEL